MKATNRASKTIDSVKMSVAGLNNTVKHFNKASSNLKFVSRLEMANLRLNKAGQIINKYSKKTFTLEQASLKVAKAEHKTNVARKKATDLLQKQTLLMKNIRRTMLAVGLAFLFAGMALKRVFQTALRSLFTTYIEIINVNDQFFQKTQELKASWTFLKFSIMDALGNSDLVIGFIDAVINLANWVAGLSEGWRRFIAIAMIGGFLIGGALMILGQIILFLLAPVQLLFVIMAVGALPVVIAMLAIVAVFLILVVVIIALALIWKSKMSIAMKIVLSFIIIVVALVAIFLILGVSVSLPWILLIAGVALAIGAFIFLVKKTGSVKEAFKVMGAGIILALGFVGDKIIDLILIPIKLVIGLINLAIKGANALGASIPEIDLGLEFGENSISAKAEEFVARKGLLSSLDKEEEKEDRKGFLDEMQNKFTDLGETMKESVKEGVGEGLADNATIIPSPNE